MIGNFDIITNIHMIFRVCFPSATVAKDLLSSSHATVHLGQGFCGVKSSVTVSSRKCDACDACDGLGGDDRRITSRAIPP